VLKLPKACFWLVLVPMRCQTRVSAGNDGGLLSSGDQVSNTSRLDATKSLIHSLQGFLWIRVQQTATDVITSERLPSVQISGGVKGSVSPHTNTTANFLCPWPQFTLLLLDVDLTPPPFADSHRVMHIPLRGSSSTFAPVKCGSNPRKKFTGQWLDCYAVQNMAEWVCVVARK
jgi:hypothetical protein